MSDDPLAAAWALSAAHESLIVDQLAAGASPSTPAAVAGLPVDVGHLVRDTVTGQYGVVEHVSRQDLIVAQG